MEYDNDDFLHSDNKFTNGLSVQRHSNLTTGWDEIDMPDWTKFGRNFPGLGFDGSYRRMSVAFGQNMQTPDDLSATEFIVDDVPYAGALGVELNWTAFNDDVFAGYGLIVGVVGPLSGAEQMQKLFHIASNSTKPRGWDHQLPNELVVNLNGMFKKKLGRMGSPGQWSADLAIGGDFGIGNALVFAEAALEARAGFNVPKGFGFVPNPLGRGLAYDATLITRGKEKVSVYFSIVARKVRMPYFVFLDGNHWRENYGVDKGSTLTQLITGLHVNVKNWRVHFSVWQTSDDLTPRVGSKHSNDFGTVAIEWKFN